MDAILGVLFLWLLLSALVGMYADSRGRSGPLYFFISILLSPVLGFVIAAVASSESRAAASPAPAASSLKKCPDCAEMIQAEARKCRFCGALF